mmetsp:Transcript_7397/g.12189  ORF Transcript_7397/g.12189 Transcript_7397/m.12189 type:complete len:408 (-) Transcript_7397:398-1621(-)
MAVVFAKRCQFNSIVALFVALNIVCQITPNNNFANAFTPPDIERSRLFNNKRIIPRHSRTSLSVIGTGAASLLAGSVGGAIGVGIAYPLDTLKTKSQVYRSRQPQQQRQIQDDLTQQQLQISSQENTTDTVLQSSESGVVHFGDDDYKIESPEDDLISLVKLILEEEGIAGFFGGVKAMMIGQALIKSVAFSANALALESLADFDWNSIGLGDVVGTPEHAIISSSFMTLILAASFSGFVTSFLVTPVERVKVMMQAQSTNDAAYANELECIKAVLKNEGILGLFSRGLGPTLAREVPSYAIYFVVYGLLIHTSIAENNLGAAAPLVCGAMSGCACWIPVYPIDVIKTLVQNTEGGDSSSAFDIAVQLYKEEGPGAFFNGLTPKMLRASVNHAVTFWVYDLMMDVLV